MCHGGGGDAGGCSTGGGDFGGHHGGHGGDAGSSGGGHHHHHHHVDSGPVAYGVIDSSTYSAGSSKAGKKSKGGGKNPPNLGRSSTFGPVTQNTKGEASTMKMGCLCAIMALAVLTMPAAIVQGARSGPAPAPAPSGGNGASSAAQVTPIILTTSSGLQAHILPIGATIQRLNVPNQHGVAEDVVLGYDDPKIYQDNNSPYFGGIVGRVANRIANATFNLDGKTYNLGANDRGNTLHGGFTPLFENSTWDVLESSGNHVKLHFTSPEGAQGFPGSVSVHATYTLTKDDQLQLVMEATADKTTPINLAQHSYFNLNGEASGLNVLNHDLYINGDYITPVNYDQIPTGGLIPVNNTPFDFTTPRPIGSRIKQVTYPPPYVGYDHNWALFGLGWDAASKAHLGAISNDVKLAVTLHSPASGRYMDLSTNMPGLQFYSGNNLNGSVVGKGAYAYPVYGGMALETQVWPDAEHEPKFPQSILQPGQTYVHKWFLRFYTKPAGAATAPAPATSGAAVKSSMAPGPGKEVHTASIP